MKKTDWMDVDGDYWWIPDEDDIDELDKEEVAFIHYLLGETFEYLTKDEIKKLVEILRRLMVPPCPQCRGIENRDITRGSVKFTSSGPCPVCGKEER